MDLAEAAAQYCAPTWGLSVVAYMLRTASGERSWQLEGYLTGMGVRGCFVDLYAVDLVDTAKASRLFYERIFMYAGIAPDDALVVDDSERRSIGQPILTRVPSCVS
jgi:hypothetical protein